MEAELTFPPMSSPIASRTLVLVPQSFFGHTFGNSVLIISQSFLPCSFSDTSVTLLTSLELWCSFWCPSGPECCCVALDAASDSLCWSSVGAFGVRSGALESGESRARFAWCRTANRMGDGRGREVAARSSEEVSDRVCSLLAASQAEQGVGRTAELDAIASRTDRRAEAPTRCTDMSASSSKASLSNLADAEVRADGAEGNPELQRDQLLASRYMARRVSYIHSQALIDATDALPSNIGRARPTHELISAFDLLELDDEAEDGAEIQGARARVVEPIPATREQLTRFHDERFVGKFMLIRSAFVY